MLLIHCPYCQEERPELEFRNTGEAHIERPKDIAGISDEEFEKFFSFAPTRRVSHMSAGGIFTAARGSSTRYATR
ncbi:MAG: hypothetical protein HoeaKO_05300 [Hoeflea alexandrii]